MAAWYKCHTSVYSFKLKGKKIRLLPTPHPNKIVDNKKSAYIIVSGTQWLSACKNECTTFALLVTTHEMNQHELAPTILSLLNQFKDIAPQELLNQHPPIQEIQHQINFIPGTTLPN